MGVQTSFNRYAYGANNPYKYTDPDGREIADDGNTFDQKEAEAQNSNEDYSRSFETGELKARMNVDIQRTGLREITSHPNWPEYMTPEGTYLVFNKPPPGTVLPFWAHLDVSIDFVDNLGNFQVTVSGGAELWDHQGVSEHYNNRATDISGPKFNDLTTKEVQKAALGAGYTHGQFESEAVNKDKEHWHNQIGAGNGVPAW